MRKKRVGEIGEDLAVRFFKKHGYKVVARNFSTRFGEIDLIAFKSGLLLFVEVKTRMGRGQPEWGISRKKISQVQRMAEVYLVQEKPKYQNLRVDVVCIDLNAALKADDIRHYKNMTLGI